MVDHSSGDFELLSAYAREGSEAAFAALVSRYAGLVYGAALRKTAQTALAEEAAQNTFAILARKARPLARRPESLAGWLHRTAGYEAAKAARSECRHRRKMNALTQQQKIARASHDAVGPAHDRLGGQLDDAIGRLGESDRRLILLHHFRGLSLSEIAAQSGRSATAVQKQHQRALAKLAARLRRSGAPACGSATLGAAVTAALSAPAPAGIVSGLAPSALASSSSITGAALAANTILTMSAPKTAALTAIVIALIAAAALDAQRRSVNRQKEAIAHLAAENQRLRSIHGLPPGASVSAAVSGGAGSRARNASTPASGGARIDLHALADDAYEARRRGSLESMKRLIRSAAVIAELPANDFDALVSRLEAADISPEKRALLVGYIGDTLEKDDPAKALEMAGRFLRNAETNALREYQNQAASALRKLASREPAAAIEWFHAADRNGLFEGRGIHEDWGRERALGALMGGLIAADPAAALGFCRSLDEGQRREALSAASSFGVTSSNRDRFMAFAESAGDPAFRRNVRRAVTRNIAVNADSGAEITEFIKSLDLPPDESARLVREAASIRASGIDAPIADILQWTAANSPPEAADVNMAAALGARAAMDPDAADAAFTELRAAGASDRLVSEYIRAGQLDRRDPARALKFIADLSEPADRAAAAQGVAAIWLERNPERLAAAFAESGLSESEIAAAVRSKAPAQD